jgi:hypothetical protein
MESHCRTSGASRNATNRIHASTKPRIAISIISYIHAYSRWHNLYIYIYCVVHFRMILRTKVKPANIMSESKTQRTRQIAWGRIRSTFGCCEAMMNFPWLHTFTHSEASIPLIMSVPSSNARINVSVSFMGSSKIDVQAYFVGTLILRSTPTSLIGTLSGGMSHYNTLV